MHNITFGYDSLLLTYTNSRKYGDVTQKVFTLPGYNQGNYIHEWEKHAGNKQIFSKSKNQIEKDFNIIFPVHVEEEQTIFQQQYLENTCNFCSTDIAILRRMQGVNLIEDTVDNLLSQDKRFIYPYSVINEIFFTVDIPLPPKRVIEAVKRGKATIVFFYGAEGHTYSIKKLEKLMEFTNRVGVEVHYYHSNLKLPEAYEAWKKIIPNQIAPKLKIHRFSAFELDPWCIQLDRTNKNQMFSIQQNYFNLVNEHKITKSIINKDNLKKFLIFNRRPRLYRQLIHAAVMSDDTLKSNTYTGIESNPYIDESISMLEARATRLHRGDRILNYVQKNKERYKDEGYKLDVDLNENQAFNYPLSFYYNTIISVVTETETHHDCVFFTEKIFKAILGLHPFILISSPFFLQTLRDEGYRTFDKFWDESYDSIKDPDLRFNAVLKLIEDLNRKSSSELTDMYFNMQEVLHHNYVNFLSNTRGNYYLSSLEKLSSDNPNDMEEKQAILINKTLI